MKNRDHFVALDEAEAALGNALEATLEVAGLERKRGMILPFQPLSISFDDLKYFVDMPAVSLAPLSIHPMLFIILIMMTVASQVRFTYQGL